MTIVTFCKDYKPEHLKNSSNFKEAMVTAKDISYSIYSSDFSVIGSFITMNARIF